MKNNKSYKQLLHDLEAAENELEELEGELEDIEGQIIEKENEIADLKARIPNEVAEQIEAEGKAMERQRYYLKKRYGSDHPASIRDYWMPSSVEG